MKLIGIDFDGKTIAEESIDQKFLFTGDKIVFRRVKPDH